MAVTKTTSLEACLNMIEGLGDKIGMNAPGLARESIALVRGLKSPENTSGLSDVRVIGNDGKCLTVQYDYFEPDCSPTNKEKLDLCNFEGEKTPNPKRTVTTTMDCVRNRSGFLDYNDFLKVCETPNEVASHALEQAALQIISDMSCDIYQQMAANVGVYPSSGDDSATATKTVNLLKPDGTLNIGAFAAMKGAFGRHVGDPIMFGGEMLKRAETIAEISSRTGGVDYNPDTILRGLPVFTDYKIDDALGSAPGDSYALLARKGAFRLIEGYTNVGIYEVLNDPHVTRTTTEIFGVGFDLYTKWDPTCMRFTWILQKQYDLFCLPADCYADCLNYVDKLLYKIGCGEWDCTQTLC